MWPGVFIYIYILLVVGVWFGWCLCHRCDFGKNVIWARLNGLFGVGVALDAICRMGMVVLVGGLTGVYVVGLK